ncbi:unnamed protein product [Rhizophagus irregularis]|nr:unnamed protein product [Rhizophagus irregularis]
MLAIIKKKSSGAREPAHNSRASSNELIDLKENLNFQFNDHLNEWLEKLQQNEDNEYDGKHDEYSESKKDFSDINVKDIETSSRKY